MVLQSSSGKVNMLLTAENLRFLFILPIFLVSLTIHEYAHGWMAYKFGDDTAARMGRLTLNPLAHISLFGTIILPFLVHFGWAKPVPVNFSVLSRKQIFMVAAAGPASNLILAAVLAAVFHIFGLQPANPVGSFLLLSVLFNIILAVFNLLPVPPLDGSRIVFACLKSPQAVNIYRKFARSGMFILIAFLLLGGFRIVVLPVVGLFYTLLGLPLPALFIIDDSAKRHSNPEHHLSYIKTCNCQPKLIEKCTVHPFNSPKLCYWIRHEAAKDNPGYFEFLNFLSA